MKIRLSNIEKILLVFEIRDVFTRGEFRYELVTYHSKVFCYRCSLDFVIMYDASLETKQKMTSLLYILKKKLCNL